MVILVVTGGVGGGGEAQGHITAGPLTCPGPCVIPRRTRGPEAADGPAQRRPWLLGGRRGQELAKEAAADGPLAVFRTFQRRLHPGKYGNRLKSKSRGCNSLFLAIQQGRSSFSLKTIRK